MKRPRKGDGLPHVVEATDPRDSALDAHTKSAVGHASVTAQVQVPLEGFSGQLVLIDAAAQQLIT